jgi:hypothetical protein
MIDVEIKPEYYEIEIGIGQVTNDQAAANAALAQDALNQILELDRTSWIKLASEWSVEPFLIQTTSEFEIYQYENVDGIYYRAVPLIYDPTLDAFYEEDTLETLITSRG